MAVLMAVHWLVTGLLLNDLYSKYCDHVKDGNCNDVDGRFTALAIMSYISVGGWVSTVIAYCIAQNFGGRKVLFTNNYFHPS